MSRTRLNKKQLETIGNNNITTDNELAVAFIEHKEELNPHGQYLTNESLNKLAIGLSNVDNTSDSSKPISLATLDALNLKINLDLVNIANGVASLDSNSKILESAIPNLDYSKIISGKPTTILGYGITDAQPLNNNLTGIASLISANGILRKTATNTWLLDTENYYNSTTGVPWSKITGTPSILPDLSSTQQIAAISGTAIIPYDNTTPLITEGTELTRITYSPSNISSKMKIEGNLLIDCSTSNRNIVLSVFRDSTCIGVITMNFISAGRPQILSFLITDLNMGNLFGISNPVYSVRIGVNSSATWYVNRQATSVFNGLLTTNSIIFSEYI